MADIVRWVMFLSVPIAISGLFGMALFGMFRWLLARGGWAARAVLALALAALGVGVAYGLLRLTGAIRFPTDTMNSANFFDASWRDDGAYLLWLCGGPFAGVLSVCLAGRTRGREEG